LLCLHCKHPFSTSPFNLFYGYDKDDTFTCDKCPKDPPSDDDKVGCHFHTHPLVRCKPRMEDPAEPTDSQRIIALEKRGEETERKLDALVREVHTLDNIMSAKMDDMGEKMSLLVAGLREIIAR